MKLLQEMWGYCVTKDYKYHKAFMLYGSGKNGKSTLIELLKGFLGERNYSSVSLHDLCYKRFAKAKLYGKLANLHADIPSKKLIETGNFKMLTGEDTLWADVKHKEGFDFRNHAKLIFSANELPRTRDTTLAFFRRWIIIEFPNIFTGEDEDPTLPDSIMTEEEMSGLLNWALEGLKRLREQGGFSKTETIEDVKSEWILRTDPLRAFVDRFVEVKKGAMIKKKDFESALGEFCEEHDLEPPTSSVIGRTLPTLIPQVKRERPKIEGKQVRVWRNIKFKDTTDKEYIQDISKTYPRYAQNNSSTAKDIQVIQDHP